MVKHHSADGIFITPSGGESSILLRISGKVGKSLCMRQRHPDEHLNRDFKTVLRTSDRVNSKNGLLQKATTFMKFLSKTPKRVMAYFKHALVQYAKFSAI